MGHKARGIATCRTASLLPLERARPRTHEPRECPLFDAAREQGKP